VPVSKAQQLLVTPSVTVLGLHARHRGGSHAYSAFSFVPQAQAAQFTTFIN